MKANKFHLDLEMGEQVDDFPDNKTKLPWTQTVELPTHDIRITKLMLWHLTITVRSNSSFPKYILSGIGNVAPLSNAQMFDLLCDEINENPKPRLLMKIINYVIYLF